MWTHQHQHFDVHQLAALSDNYIYLLAPHNSDVLAAIDPAETEPVVAACDELGKPLTHILNTHHHWDHTGANLALQKHYGCSIIANRADAERIPGIDHPIEAGEKFSMEQLQVQVLDMPGHTLGHIAYVIDDALFCGDTMFGAGCGRLFEGSPQQMWHSLQQLAVLPEVTRVYCAHEYTLANLRFASEVDSDNPQLIERLQRDTETQARNEPTIPSTIGLERSTNPFLRPADPAFCTAYATTHQVQADPLSVFTDIRNRKDHW